MSPPSDEELAHHFDQWMAHIWPSNGFTGSIPVDPDTYNEFYSNTPEQTHPPQTQGWETPPDEPERSCDELLNLFTPEGSALTDGDFTGPESAPAGDLDSPLPIQRRRGVVPNISTTKLRLRFDPYRVFNRVDDRHRNPVPDPLLLVPALGAPINTAPQPPIRKGLGRLALVLLEMRDVMGEHILKESLVLTDEQITTMGRKSLDKVVAKEDNLDLFEWAATNPQAKAEINKMYQTAKVIKDAVRDVVQISAVTNFKIYEALASKPVADMAAFISDLTHERSYLYGPLMVGDSTQTIAFADKGIVDAARQLLFSRHNFQKYIKKPSQDLEALLVFIAFVEEWVFSQYSTGSFSDSILTIPKDRRKSLRELEIIFRSLGAHRHHALAVVIYTQKGILPLWANDPITYN